MSLAGTLFLASLIISVLVHELLHLLAARASGMRVDRYFVGFGPTLISRRLGETEVGLKLLPLGGFVSIVGMEPGSERIPPLHAMEHVESDSFAGLVPELMSRGASRPVAERLRDSVRYRRSVMPEASLEEIMAGSVYDVLGPSRRRGDLAHRVLRGDEGRHYSDASASARAFAIASGPASHLVIAFVLLASMLVIWPPQSYQMTSEVSEVLAGSPAEVAGMLPGDVVVAVDGLFSSEFSELRAELRSRPGTLVEVAVEREGQLHPLKVALDAVDDAGEMVGVAGFTVMPGDPDPLGPIGVVRTALSGPQEMGFPGGVTTLVSLSVRGISHILSPSGLRELAYQATGRTERGLDGAVSIVGAVGVADQVVSSPYGGWYYFLALLAAVNVFLAIFNLVPLPPFDGGHLTKVLIDKVGTAVRRALGRKGSFELDQRVLNALALPVYALLLFVLAATLWLDVTSPIRI